MTIGKYVLVLCCSAMIALPAFAQGPPGGGEPGQGGGAGMPQTKTYNVETSIFRRPPHILNLQLFHPPQQADAKYASGAPLFFLLFGGVFLVMDIYFISGLFVADSIKRKGTYCGVTVEKDNEKYFLGNMPDIIVNSSCLCARQK